MIDHDLDPELDELGRRVTVALRSRADRVVPTNRSFAEASAWSPGEGHGRGRRRALLGSFRGVPRVRAALVAAAVVVALVVAAVWAVPGELSGTERVATSPKPGPTASTTIRGGPSRPSATVQTVGLAPTWLPPGLFPVAAHATLVNGGGFGETVQLFGTAAGTPELFVELQRVPGAGGSQSVLGTPVQLRGTTGGAVPAKDFASSTTTISWYENGLEIQASFRNLSTAEAANLLDSLQWKSADDPLAGFAPGAGSSLVAVGPTAAQPGVQNVISLEFGYADQVASNAPRQGLQLTVRTTGPTGGATHDFLEAEFHGVRQPDGSYESYDPDFSTLSRVWPDGHSAWIDANGTAISQAQEQQVADNLAFITSTAYRTLEAEVATTIERDLPTLASATTASGTITLRGTASLVSLCLEIGNDGDICSAATTPNTAAPADQQEYTLSILLGDQWTVVAAAPSPVAVETPEVSAETASASGWSFLLAQPSPDHDSIVLSTPGGDASQPGPVVYRPAA
jgi:hypothetical protein